MKYDFDETAFRKYQTNKEKDYHALLTHDQNFRYESVRKYAETYISIADKSAKMGSDERILIKYHGNIKLLFDSDVFSDLYDKLFNVEDSGSKITQLSSLTSGIECPMDEENDIDEWLDKFERISHANGWSEYEKGKKLPIW